MSTILAARHRSEHLCHGGTYYDGQGRFALKRQVEQSHAEAHALLVASKLPTLKDYLATVVRNDDSGFDDGGAQVGVPGGPASDADDEIVGPAAVASIGEKGARPVVLADSPAKPRPAVPSFPPSGAASPPASLRRGTSLSSLKDSSDDLSDDGTQATEWADDAGDGDLGIPRDRMSIFVFPSYVRSMSTDRTFNRTRCESRTTHYCIS